MGVFLLTRVPYLTLPYSLERVAPKTPLAMAAPSFHKLVGFIHLYPFLDFLEVNPYTNTLSHCTKGKNPSSRITYVEPPSSL